MDNLTIKSNENKYIIFNIKDSDDGYFDLTGFVATIQIQEYGESSLQVNTGCTISNAIEGQCKYLYDGSLPIGSYKAEIEFTYVSTGLKYDTPTFDIDIVAHLPY